MASTQQTFQNITRPDRRTLSFTMSPTRVTYANTLRRAIQTEVHVLGFRADMQENGTTTDVKVIKNSTPMSNEMLADRVGLLPVYTPPTVGNGWDKESVLFKLHVKNETPDYKYISASDFECYERQEDAAERVRIPNTKFFRPDPVTGETSLLAVLKPYVEGQEPEEIHIEAYASLGKGKEHTRFNPTSQSSYGYTRDETPARILALWQQWLNEQKKVDPAEVEKPENAERKKILENEFRSLEINRCYMVDEEGEPNSFDFTVETIGMMDTYQILLRAFTAVSTLALRYATIANDATLPETLEIRPANVAMKAYDFVFTNEDHTLGNLLQTWLDDNKVGRGPSEDGVLFAGYNIPHPLRNEMVLRVATQDGKEQTARKVVAQAAKGCAELFAKYGNAFIAATSGRLADLAEPSTPVIQAEPPTVWEAHKEAKRRTSAPMKKK